MIININSGSSGWGNYVLYGSKNKPRDNSKVELLDGDISLGDYYSKNNKYEDSYYTVVLGFKGKPSKEVIESAYSDFKEHFFKGFRQDEYHIDAVIHYDTDDTHIHIRIPKQNLLTNTHLQLYYDKIDRPRKQLIQDYISLKYGLEIARETSREIIKEQSHEYINKWREERNQEPFDFSKKKGKELAEKQINSYISDLITSNLIEKREDITTILEELGLEVIKENGLDIKKDFCYATIQNETGKMRIKGEFYNDRFWQHNAKDRRTQIESNRRINQDTEPSDERFARVQRELRKANEKRYNRVTELFRASRERAINEIKATTSKAIEINRQTARGELGSNRELTKSTNNKNISNSRNIRDNNRDIIDHNLYRRIDDTSRTTATESNQTARRERVETFINTRNARKEFLSKLTKTAGALREKYISSSSELPNSNISSSSKLPNSNTRNGEQIQELFSTEQGTIRELEGRTKQLIQESKRNAGELSKLREITKRVKGIIADTREWLKEKTSLISNFYKKEKVKEEIEIKIDTKTKPHQAQEQQDWGLHR